MIYFTLILLFLISAALGFFLESININRTLCKRLLFGTAVLCSEFVAFALWIWLAFPWWKKQMLLLLKEKSPLINMGLNIPIQVQDWIVWFLFALIALLLIETFLIAFNVRHTLKNPWISLCGLGIFAGIFHVSFMWFFQGIGTFVVLFGKYEPMFPSGTTLLVSLLFTCGLILLWTFYSLRGERSGIKIFLIQIGFYLGICLGLWSVALISAISYGQCQKRNAVSCGTIPFRIENDLPQEAQTIRRALDDFRDNHPNFELPFESVYDWKTNEKNANRIPNDRRVCTLKLFDSMEMRDFVEKQEKLMEFAANQTVLYMPLLNSVRSYARIRSGRAALFLETGQPGKILPELMKIVAIDREVLNDSPFIISELVRIACRSIWYTEMVKLGPDDKQYEPVYHEALQFMKSRKIHLQDEAGFYLGSFSSLKCGTYREILAYPSTNAMLGKGLAHTLSLSPKLAGQSRREVFQNISEDYERQALKGRISIVIGTTALALKCYRAEHGVYPDKLEKLVPGYLDKLFVCPYTGKPLLYNSNGKIFTLSLVSDTPAGKITSEVRY